MRKGGAVAGRPGTRVDRFFATTSKEAGSPSKYTLGSRGQGVGFMGII